MTDSLLEDLLDEDLAEGPLIITEEVSNFIMQGAFDDRSTEKAKTVGKAKSLLEFFDLVRQCIDDYETRAGTIESARVTFTEEEPDVKSASECITFSLVSRQPGGFGQGPPGEAKVHNRRPMLREILEDPENPKYKNLIFGYWYDNVVRFTCWARTNKAANARALWFENLMEEYTWWLIYNGVNRVFWDGQGTDLVVRVNENKWYGRPIDFWVRTETVRTFKQKTLEEIILRTAPVAHIPT